MEGPRIDDATARRLVERYGPAVATPWLATVGEVADRLAARWSLDWLVPVGRGGSSVVLRGTRGGAEVYLKLVPDPDRGAREAAALRQWAPSGHAPALLEHDGASGAVLIAGIDGVLLADGSTSPAADDAELVALLRALHGAAPPPEPFPPLRERVEHLFSLWEGWFAADPALAGIRAGGAEARALADDRGAVRPLVHGDLHPGNILRTTDGRLVAIDPCPCAGDPAFDLVDACMLGSDDAADWARRAAALAPPLGIDPDRVVAWCEAFAPAVAALARRRARLSARS